MVRSCARRWSRRRSIGVGPVLGRDRIALKSSSMERLCGPSIPICSNCLPIADERRDRWVRPRASE